MSIDQSLGAAFLGTPRGRGHPPAVEALQGQEAHPGEAALDTERVLFPEGGGSPVLHAVHLVEKFVPGGNSGGRGVRATVKGV